MHLRSLSFVMITSSQCQLLPYTDTSSLSFCGWDRKKLQTFLYTFFFAFLMQLFKIQEAQLSLRDCAMRHVSWNPASCHATVRKLLVRQVLNKSKLWSWRVTVWQCRTRSSRFHCPTHTHPFNGPFSGTTQVSQYQKSKTDLDFTEARDSEWQWHQFGHMQVCTLLQTDNHASTPPLCFFTGRMPFVSPNQQRQSTEGNSK